MTTDDGQAVTIVEEVEAFLRSVAAGEGPDLGVMEDGHSEAAQARALELVLEPYRRYVRHKDDQKIGDFYVDRPSRWGNPHRRQERTADERRRVTLAFARDFAKRSPAQLGEEVGVIRRVLRSGARLVCGSCPPLVCHGQVWAFWALCGRSPLSAAPGSGARR